jgi:hypothetical protein
MDMSLNIPDRAMSVGELVDILKKFPRDVPVSIGEEVIVGASLKEMDHLLVKEMGISVDIRYVELLKQK